jgi:hypothetical protein
VEKMLTSIAMEGWDEQRVIQITRMLGREEILLAVFGANSVVVEWH